MATNHIICMYYGYYKISYIAIIAIWLATQFNKMDFYSVNMFIIKCFLVTTHVLLHA